MIAAVVTVADTASLSAVQRAHILEILRRERGNKARAARALGINRRSLYRLLEKYGIGVGETPPATVQKRCRLNVRTTARR